MADGKNVIFSFFSGAGFLDLGFEKAGFDIVLANEFVPLFVRAQRHARKKMSLDDPKYGFHTGSVEEFAVGPMKEYLRASLVNEKARGNTVGFIAGPPCPDFSVAGKQAGGEGEKGRLSRVYIDLIREQKPDFFLFENVKGLWSTKRHREFYDRLVRDLHHAGYQTHERLVNALEYGVPQDRDRVILVGFLSDMSDKQLMFPWETNVKYHKQSIKKMEWPSVSPYIKNGTLPRPIGLPLELSVEYWFLRNKVDVHPNSGHHFIARQALMRFESIPEGYSKGKSFKRLHRWRYSPTCAYGNNEVHVHPYLPRRLSAAEALAIQSLPKEYELPPDMPLSAMFKMIGNGVPYRLGQGVALSVKQHLIEISIAHQLAIDTCSKELYNNKTLNQSQTYSD